MGKGLRFVDGILPEQCSGIVWSLATRLQWLRVHLLFQTVLLPGTDRSLKRMDEFESSNSIKALAVGGRKDHPNALPTPGHAVAKDVEG